MKLPFRLLVALGSPPPAFMNVNTMTQPLTFIVEMINLIRKEAVKITYMAMIHMKGTCIIYYLKKPWDEISRPMHIFLKKISDHTWLNMNSQNTLLFNR